MLSERLERIAGYTHKCRLVADIGTDHAYIPIYLAKSGIADKIIASDVSLPSLKKAEANVKTEGCADKVECRLGDGLSVISDDEIVNIVIAAGMGGMLMIHTLKANEKALNSAEKLILQPQKDNNAVRMFVHKKGFKITADDIFKDEGKIYNIMVCEKGQDVPYSTEEYIFGKIPVKEKNPVLAEFIACEMNRMKEVGERMVCETPKAVERKNELKEKYNMYAEVLKCL